MEQVEIDLRPRYEDPAYENNPNFPLNKWYQLLAEATSKAGRPIEYDLNTPQLLESLGFADVRDYVVPLPLHFDAHWPPEGLDKKIAKWYCSCLGVKNDARDYSLESLSLAPFTRILGWSLAQWKAFEAQIWNSVSKSDIRVYHTL